MKIKLIVTALSLAISNLFVAQERLGSFENSLKENVKDVIESFAIVNNTEIASFLLEKKHIYGYLLDKDFQVTKSISSEDVRRKYRISLGKMYDSNNNYKIILTDKKRQKFALIHFNFDHNKIEISEDKFDKRNLVFIQSISRKDKIHLLFLNRMTSNIIARTYNLNSETTNTEFDFSNEKFLIDDKNEISLSKLIPDVLKPNSREIPNISYELKKINDESYKTEIKSGFGPFEQLKTRKIQTPPNSIETAVRLNKLYIPDTENIIITLDKNRFYTQVLTLNLNNGSYTYKKIKKPLFEVSKIKKKSNSFLLNNNIFTVTSTNEMVVVNIYDFEKNSLIKELIIEKEKPIKFKNTPIIQQGGSFDKYRDLEKTNKFIRKISDGSIGITASNTNKGYEITIGGLNEGLKTTQIIGAIALATATFDVNSLGAFQEGGFFNPYQTSFNDYSRKRSIRIKCLFDENFNHIEGEIQKNIYDKIGDFVSNEEISKKMATTIFPIKKGLMFGAYDKKTKTYSFYKFEN